MTPDRFYNDMLSLATQSPRDAADVANTWRNRFLNMAEDSQSTVAKGLMVGTGAVTGFLYGGLGGMWQAEDDDIMEDWANGGYAIANLASASAGSPYKEGHAADPKRYPAHKPGTIYNVPYTLLGTIGFAILSGLKVGGETAARVTGHAAYAGTIYWSAKGGEMLGYDWQSKRLDKAKMAAGQGNAQAA
jgi:hypothetical protein